MNENDNEKKIGGVSYKDKNEDIHSFLFKDSTSIENGYRLYLQDELVAYKPIDLNDFDSLFRCNINPHIHLSRTGIIYRNVDKVFYSENDSVSFRRNAFLTDVRIIDIKGEMKIQAWAKVHPWQVLMAAPLYSTSITALLLALSIAFCLYNVLKKEDAPDGKIYTHINTLKKVFSNFPAYRIEKKRKALCFNRRYFKQAYWIECINLFIYHSVSRNS